MLESQNYISSNVSTVTSWYEKQLASQISSPSAFATQTKPLLKTQYTSQVVYNNVSNFSNITPSTTISRAMNSDNIAAAIIHDCVPCLERILKLDNFHPFDDFINMLQQELNKRLGYLTGMVNSLTGKNINLCDLMRYLNSLCLPDLYAILAMLSYYWIQLFKLFDLNVYSLLWSLIQPLLQGVFVGLDSLIQKFLRLIVGPIDCIISSLNHEYAKIYNVMNMDISKTGVKVNQPYDSSFSKWANENVKAPLLSNVGGLGQGLKYLQKALTSARDWLNSQIKRIRDAIKDAMGVDASASKDSLGLFEMMRWLAVIVGLVKAIIKFKQDGFTCDSNGMSVPQYNMVVQYLSDTTGDNFQIVPTTVAEYYEYYYNTMGSEVLTNPTAEQTGTFTLSQISSGTNQFQSIQDALNDILSKVTTTTTTTTAGSVPTVYNLPDCVQITKGIELAKVAKWTTELDNIS